MFGSSRAGEFLRDLRDGSDSVDFVTIGDSNAGYNGGWNIGLIDAMRELGIVMYATPLFPSSATQATGSWSNTGNGDGYGGSYITYVVPTAVGAGTDASMRSLYDEADGDADADEVADFGVMHENASAVVYPYGELYFNGGFVRSGGTFTGTAGRYVHLSQPVVASGASRTFLQASTNYRYRVVHGLHTDAGGSFQLRATDTTSGTLATSSAVDTDGGPGYGTASLLFTTGAATDHAVRCSWSATNIVGPFSSLLESVSLSSGTGFAVNNYAYNGGFSTEQLGEAMLGAAAQNGITQIIHLRMWLTELYERQTASGGSGRVVVWINSGINGSSGDTEAEWTGGMTDIINAVRNAWIACGYPEENIAFIASVTHPTSAYNDPAVEPKLTTTRAAVQGWPDDLLVAANVTVLDISAIYTGGQLAALGYFAGTGTGADQAHLTADGYKAIALASIRSAMEASAVSSITEPVTCRTLTIGGGGNGHSGGGAGGEVLDDPYRLIQPGTTLTITVPAQVAAANATSAGPHTPQAPTTIVASIDGVTQWTIEAQPGAHGQSNNFGSWAHQPGYNGFNGGGAPASNSAGGPSSMSGGKGVGTRGYSGGTNGNYTTGNIPAGGGAGAGGNGADPVSNAVGGVGGAGVTSDITGTTVTYATGGGGGAHTAGTGGAGGSTNACNNSGVAGGAATQTPTANSGAGGGGAGGANAGKQGAKGKFVLRYAGSATRLTVVSGTAPTTDTATVSGQVIEIFNATAVVTFA